MDLLSKYYPVSFNIKNSKLIAIKNIASCVFTQYRNDSCHIIAIVTHPDFRRNGYATKLIKLLQDKFENISANVLFDESTNIKFWKLLNFNISEINIEKKYYVLIWKK